jgi:predicted pyridoxine 5'-phosphate oxidase superfamily flavin-nucleotide-binding protein
MGKVYAALDDRLRAFIAAQPMFFVATAPLAADGTVNVSPKGYRDTFAVLDDTTVAYLDLTGSGAETIAHLRENGRLTIMFCSFDRQPKILRLHGQGEVVVPGHDRWASLLGHFADHVGARSVVVLRVQRIADSCGYAVPLMDLAQERPMLDDDHARRGADGVVSYQRKHNAASLDGLPALEV